MNKSAKWLKVLSLSLIAAMIAGSVSATLLQALGMPVPLLLPYGIALPVAMALALTSYSLWGAVAGLALLAGMAGIAWTSHAQAFRELFSAISAFVSSGDLQELSANGGAMACLLAAAFAGIFYLLIRSRGGVFFAGMVALTALIGANAMSDTADFRLGAPGLIALIAAYANQQQSDRKDFRLARALTPAVLAVLVAMLLTPSGRVTWAPLEKAASDLRDTFEDYFHFTQERVAFSLSEEGYDHAAMMNDTPTIRLGGPANPDPEPVMEVEAARPMLLRGAIRRDYTGYSWVDEGEKARYLYYDFTRAGTRAEVFEAEGEPPAFERAEARVRMLKEGTSTLFAPNRLTDFSMPMQNATYYNSIGEIFLARNVEAGDEYSFAAWLPASGEALSQLAQSRAAQPDDGYLQARDLCLRLPAGVEEGVYRLVNEITFSLSNDYEKAAAIQNWLVSNCRYTIDVDYPPENRDFVSYFVLDSREGYCSYYASAMAVMCRIAGLPARYIEGYSLRPDLDKVTVLTGEDAHAWVEVYLNGVGWISFDPTGSAQDAQGGGENDSSEGQEDEGEGALPPAGTEGEATPTPPPQAPDEPTSSPPPEGAPTPTATLPPEDAPTPTLPPSSEDAESPNPPEDSNLSWLWWILAILLLLLAAALLVLWARKRLLATDPSKLIRDAGDLNRAALILYRANLTLLRHLGQVPLGSETPEAFAARLSANGLDSADFRFFCQRVAECRYSGRPFQPEDVEAGLSAFRKWEKKLGGLEKIRFQIHRVFSGLGDFESIP